MVIAHQEHEYVTAIKAMVSNGDVAAVRSLADNDWSVTYMIIAASHLSGDAKAVGARITTIPASQRRNAVIDILAELAAARTAPAPVAVVQEAVAEPVPFDVAPPVIEPAAAEPAPARQRRRRVSDALAEQPAAAAPVVVQSDESAQQMVSQVTSAVESAAQNLGSDIEALRTELVTMRAELRAQLDRVSQIADALLRQASTSTYNVSLFRDGVLAFEQELAINGVISNAVFSEATAQWRS